MTTVTISYRTNFRSPPTTSTATAPDLLEAAKLAYARITSAGVVGVVLVGNAGDGRYAVRFRIRPTYTNDIIMTPVWDLQENRS